jgi:hypothetical protein
VSPMTFIVECSICAQPWEVPTMMVAGPGHFIQVPEHGMLDRSTSKPLAVPCMGVQVTAFGIGNRQDWEQRWPLRKIGRPLPEVLDGSGVRYVG